MFPKKKKIKPGSQSNTPSGLSLTGLPSTSESDLREQLGLQSPRGPVPSSALSTSTDTRTPLRRSAPIPQQLPAAMTSSSNAADTVVTTSPEKSAIKRVQANIRYIVNENTPELCAFLHAYQNVPRDAGIKTAPWAQAFLQSPKLFVRAYRDCRLLGENYYFLKNDFNSQKFYLYIAEFYYQRASRELAEASLDRSVLIINLVKILKEIYDQAFEREKSYILKDTHLLTVNFLQGLIEYKQPSESGNSSVTGGPVQSSISPFTREFIEAKINEMVTIKRVLQTKYRVELRKIYQDLDLCNKRLEEHKTTQLKWTLVKGEVKNKTPLNKDIVDNFIKKHLVPAKRLKKDCKNVKDVHRVIDTHMGSRLITLNGLKQAQSDAYLFKGGFVDIEGLKAFINNEKSNFNKLYLLDTHYEVTRKTMRDEPLPRSAATDIFPTEPGRKEPDLDAIVDLFCQNDYSLTDLATHLSQRPEDKGEQDIRNPLYHVVIPSAPTSPSLLHSPTHPANGDKQSPVVLSALEEFIVYDGDSPTAEDVSEGFDPFGISSSSDDIANRAHTPLPDTEETRPAFLPPSAEPAAMPLPRTAPFTVTSKRRSSFDGSGLFAYSGEDSQSGAYSDQDNEERQALSPVPVTTLPPGPMY